MSSVTVLAALCLSLFVLSTVSLPPVAAQYVTFQYYPSSLSCSGNGFGATNDTTNYGNGEFITPCLIGGRNNTLSFQIACSATNSSYYYNVYSDTACQQFNATYQSTSGQCDVTNNNPNFTSALIVNCYNGGQSPGNNGASLVTATASSLVGMLLLLALSVL